MGFQDLHSLFLPASSAPWQLGGAFPDLRPSTPPVRVSAAGSLTPPAAPKPWAVAKPALLRALTTDNLQAVKEALADEPDAAQEPFWEQGCEPPLCCAVRLCCAPAIVAELLSRGADVHAEDVHGCTPYALLQRVKAKQQTMVGPPVALYEWDIVEGLLLEAGAQAAESNAYVQEMQEDPWGAVPLPFAPLGALPPPLPWSSGLPPMALQY